MARESSFGVKTFSGASLDALEDNINAFLQGDGTMENRRKQLTQPPQFVISGATFYAMIVYVEFGG